MTWGRAEQNRAEIAPAGRTERSGKQKGFLQFPRCAQVSLPPASVVQCTFLFFLSSPEFWHFHFSFTQLLLPIEAGGAAERCTRQELEPCTHGQAAGHSRARARKAPQCKPAPVQLGAGLAFPVLACILHFQGRG